MKHLKLFETTNEYNNWLNSNNYITPYIVKDKESKIVLYQKYKNPYYDSKILYLESSGEQWINLDYGVWNAGLSGEIVMQRLDDNTGEKAYIGRVGQSGFDLYTINNGKIGLWLDTTHGQIDLQSNDTETIDKNIHHVIFDMNKQTETIYLKVDNDEYSESSINFGTRENLNIQLFSHREYYNSTGRIYSCKLWYDGVMIYDLIPVRKDGVGYMFDKLSNKLFGNSANGVPLILGPDI